MEYQDAHSRVADRCRKALGDVDRLTAALVEIMEGIEARARSHDCLGIHCGVCNPMEWVEVARKALDVSFGGK